MRKILYRVYQKNFKRMLPVVGIEYDVNGPQVITVDNRGMDRSRDVIPTYSSYVEGGSSFPLNALILMQSIGFWDKDGTMIYEGDICEYSDKENYPRPLTVEWGDEYACFAFVDKDDFNKKYYFTKDDMNNIKVIRHIFENKTAIIKDKKLKVELKE